MTELSGRGARAPVGRWIGLGLLLLAAFPTHAAEIFLDADVTVSGAMPLDLGLAAAQGPLPVEGTLGEPLLALETPERGASVFGRLDFGLFQLRAQARARSGEASAFVGGEWRDTFTIDAASAGTVNIGIQATGSTGASAPGSSPGDRADASWRFEFRSSDGGGGFGGEAVQIQGGALDTRRPEGGFLQFTIRFEPGVPIDVIVRGRAMAEASEAGGQETSEAAVDFLTGIEWLGFLDVRDHFGLPIETFSVASDSGFDYSQPVPEPGSLAPVCALAVLSGLASTARSRRHRSRRLLPGSTRRG